MPFSKADQTRRERPRRASNAPEGFKAARTPLRKRSRTNSRAVAWREEYLPKREVFLRAHPLCEMNITTPAVCPPYQHDATEIQHMIQVSLDPSIANLLDETHWLASCHAANTWCGRHPMEAQALGLELRPNYAPEDEGEE